MKGETTLPKVAALDGLRGAAVAGVLLFHGGHLIGGYLGVDLFFVLSGFLITSLLLVESTNTGRIGLGHFWARRARRLLPALAALVGVGIYCLVFASPTQLGNIRLDGLATLGYVANWRAIFAGRTIGRSSPRLRLCSTPGRLAIEEQFYLVWPLVFVGLLAWFGRRAPRATFAVALIGAAVSAALMWALYDPLDASRCVLRDGYSRRQRAPGSGTRRRVGRLGAGSRRSRSDRIGSRGAGRSRSPRGRVDAVDGQSAWLYRGGFTLCGIAVVAVIAAVMHPTRGPIGAVLSFRLLCLLGLISYGVYLWHWPVFIVLNETRTDLEGWPLMGARFGVTVVIAVVSYLILEQPIRHGAGSTRMWRVALPATAVVVVLVVVGATLNARPAGRVSEQRLSVLAAKARRAPAGVQRTMVVGDSVAFYLARGMAAVASEETDLVLNRAHIACVFPDGAEAIDLVALGRTQKNPISCDTDWDREVEALKPQRVLMINWTGGDARLLYGGQWMSQCDDAYLRMYRARLTLSVQKFQSSGITVALANSPYGQYQLDDAHRKDRNRVDCVNRVVKDVARATDAEFVDLRGLVCPEAPACLERIDGHILRPDGVHFRADGGQVVGRWLLEQLNGYRAAPGSGQSSGPGPATVPSTTK